VKAENNIIKYASKADYLKRAPTAPAEVIDASSSVEKKLTNKTDAKQKGLGEELKKGPKKVEKAIKDKVKEGASAGKHLITQAASSLANGLGINPLSVIPIPDIGISSSAPKAAAVKEAPENSIVNKPGIFFVKGFSVNPFSGDDEGLASMAENVPTAELFSWDNSDQIIDAIKSRPHTQPIILVGHGMGSDTIVDVANRLNDVEHGFMRVDLLVTMDSIGTDNDIIPQNVRENFNVISDADYLFNDGPNIARKKSMTAVTNELRMESHNELEVSPEVQFLVYEKINRSLMGVIERRDLKNTLNDQMKILRMHQLASPSSSSRIQSLLSNTPFLNS
jgi:hypothetical protein